MKIVCSLSVLFLFGSIQATEVEATYQRHSFRRRFSREVPVASAQVASSEERALASSESSSSLSESLSESGSGFVPLDRIAHGARAEPGVYPYFARLVTIDSRGNLDFNFVCGGALIGEEWIVTASHCLMDKATGRLKSNLYGWEISYLCDDSDNCGQAGRRILRADEWLVPPEYTATEFYLNDVAVSHLVDRMEDSVPYAAPDDGRVWSTLQSRVDRLRPIGIGIEESGRYSDVVRTGDMTFLDNRSCEGLWGFPSGLFIDRVFCLYSEASSASTMSCPGDSGGPVVSTQWQRMDGLDVVVGVVTGGENVPCVERTKPALYGRLATFYASFIRVHVCDESKNRFGPSPVWCRESSSIAVMSQSFRPRPPAVNTEQANQGEEEDGGEETLELCMDDVPLSRDDFRPKKRKSKTKACDKLRKKTKKGLKLCERPWESNALDKCPQLCDCLLEYADNR